MLPRLHVVPVESPPRRSDLERVGFVEPDVLSSLSRLGLAPGLGPEPGPELLEQVGAGVRVRRGWVRAGAGVLELLEDARRGGAAALADGPCPSAAPSAADSSSSAERRERAPDGLREGAGAGAGAGEGGRWEVKVEVGLKIRRRAAGWG